MMNCSRWKANTLTFTNVSYSKKNWQQLVSGVNGNSGNTVSRRRSDRQDLRFSGRAAALALSQAVRAAADPRALAHFSAQPARDSPAEVHAVRDRLAHPAKTAPGPRPARRLVL